MHLVKEQSQDEGRNQAGDERGEVGRPGGLLHLCNLGFVVRVIAHFAHPGLGKENGRVPDKTDNDRGDRGDQNSEQIEIMHVHGRAP